MWFPEASMNFQGRKPKWLNNKNQTQSSIRKTLGTAIHSEIKVIYINGVQNMKRTQKWIYSIPKVSTVRMATLHLGDWSSLHYIYTFIHDAEDVVDDNICSENLAKQLPTHHRSRTTNWAAVKTSDHPKPSSPSYWHWLFPLFDVVAVWSSLLGLGPMKKTPTWPSPSFTTNCLSRWYGSAEIIYRSRGNGQRGHRSRHDRGNGEQKPSLGARFFKGNGWGCRPGEDHGATNCMTHMQQTYLNICCNSNIYQTVDQQ